MTVALAHDYLTQRGGAERVALAMTGAFPGAALHTSVYARGLTFPEFDSVDVRTSFLQAFPPFRRDPRPALPLLSAAWDRTYIDDVDVVVASSSGWAHGVRTAPGVRKVVYCHNPPRWIHQGEDYLRRSHERLGMGVLGHRLEGWDRRAAGTADRYLVNSTSVAARVRKVYGIEPEVLFPPVSVDVDGEQEAVPGIAPGYWLTVARGRGYKNVDAVVDGVRALGDGELVVVGSPAPGRPAQTGVRWCGVVSDAQLRWLYANARGLVSVSREDFGLTPLEANAFGAPAVVLAAGGFLDSTAPGVSGWWVEDESAAAVTDALRSMPTFDRDAVQAHARKFSAVAFAGRLRQVVEDVVGP